MAVTRPYDDSYLLTYSEEHVFYEVDMFFGLAAMLSVPSRGVVGPSVEDATRVNNALIEAFGIHLRNVLDFLYIDRLQPTDVVAADFFPAGTWQTIRPAISRTLQDARTRANKELAHLTTERLAGSVPQKVWAFSALANEVKPLIQLFVARASSTALSPRVAQAIR